MTGQPLTSGSAEAVVIVKAAPQVGRRHGETVCCAGIDVYGNWLRLYPVSFRTQRNLADGTASGSNGDYLTTTNVSKVAEWTNNPSKLSAI
jgi:hypothetical protein